MNAISTNSACYLGLARTNEEEVGLTLAEQCIAMERILILAKQYKNRISAAAGPLGFKEMEQARLEGRTISAYNPTGIVYAPILDGCSHKFQKEGGGIVCFLYFSR